MKRVVFGMLLLFSVNLYADGREDRFGNTSKHVSRSSAIASNDNMINITSYPAIIRTITVSSPTGNSWINFFNSSTTISGVDIATAMFVNTNTWGTIEVNKYFWRGLSYNKLSLAAPSAINIEWDYVTQIATDTSRANFLKE